MKENNMRILITNDDGIAGVGLRYLAEFAKTIGDPLVVAPKVEQSACSHRIILRRPFEVKESDAFSDIGIAAYTVDATPADCVRFAVSKFSSFDIVLSGINHGFNIGDDIAYSGTCAAAFEANFAKLPAVAFSADLGCLEYARDNIARAWRFITGNRLLDHCDMLNVNFPREPRGIKITRQGSTFYRDNFIECGENLYRASLYVAHHDNEGNDQSVDTNAVTAGFISVSPLRVSRNDVPAFQKLSGKSENW